MLTHFYFHVGVKLYIHMLPNYQMWLLLIYLDLDLDKIKFEKK